MTKCNLMSTHEKHNGASLSSLWQSMFYLSDEGMPNAQTVPAATRGKVITCVVSRADT